jgi:hypothetical protein
VDLGLAPYSVNLLYIVYVFYMFDDLTQRFHITCLASLPWQLLWLTSFTFVLVNSHIFDNIN